jgi:exosortase H (IPTLxxWG-CTERM-specific)
MTMHKFTQQADKKHAEVKKPAPDAQRETVRSGQLGFTILFALSCISLYIIILALPDSYTRPLSEHVAATLGMTLNFFGIPALTTGDIVSEKGLAFKIVPECTPLFPSVLFIGFILFHFATLRKKAAGLVMGLPALYLGNLIRLTITFLVSRYDSRFFEIVHVYLGQIFTMFLVIMVCILWLKWIDREERRQSLTKKVAGFFVRFVLLSGCLFLVWMKAHHQYIAFLDWFMVRGFSLFHVDAALARDTAIYYETFSIVVFTSLVLAIHHIPWITKIKGLSMGLGFLFTVHLFHRINNVFVANFHFTAVRSLDLSLLLVGQYLLPVLLMTYLVRQKKQKTARVAST